MKRISGEVLVPNVRWCDSFLCKLRGLMFRRHLDPTEGILLVEPVATRSAASIHMLFMAFPIAAIWLGPDFTVVDMTLARPWRPIYIPARPARYTLEAHPDVLSRVAIGEALLFDVYIDL
jgi:uncharacterized membrane protein (UPF0127 family)